MQVVPQNPGTYYRFPSRSSLGLGITQVILGGLSCILQFVSISAAGGVGLICGVIFCIAGGFAIGASRTRGKCLVVATLVMSIIAALVTVAQMCTASIFGIFYDNGYGYNDGGSTVAYCLFIMAALGFVELVIAIIQAALCCNGMCCGPSTQVVYYQGVMPQGMMVQGQPGVMMVQDQAGGMMVQGQPSGQPMYFASGQPGSQPMYMAPAYTPQAQLGQGAVGGAAPVAFGGPPAYSTAEPQKTEAPQKLSSEEY